MRERELQRDALRLLQSADEKRMAWGAYLCLGADRKQVGPILTRQIRSIVGRLERASSRQEPGSTWFTLLALLDCAIALRVNLPAQDMTQLASRGVDSELAILATQGLASVRVARGERSDRRERESCDVLAVLFKSLDSESSAQLDMAWVVAANELVQHQPQRIAPWLLRKLKFRLVVHVVDRGALRRRKSTQGYSHRRLIAPKGYPPLAVYHLVDHPVAGDVVVTSGFRSVFYRVARCAPGSAFYRDIRFLGRSRDEERLAWLMALIGKFEGLKASRDLFAEWDSEDALVSKVAVWRTETARGYERLRQELVSKGFVKASEAVKPQITVVCRDLRQDKSIKLPFPVLGKKGK